MTKKETPSPTIRTEIRFSSFSFIPSVYPGATFFYVRAHWSLRDPTVLFIDTSYVEKRVIEDDGLGQHTSAKRISVPAYGKFDAIKKLEEQAPSDSLQEFFLIRAVIEDAIARIDKITS